jgi:hypothetical protein
MTDAVVADMVADMVADTDTVVPLVLLTTTLPITSRSSLVSRLSTAFPLLDASTG